MGGLSRKERPLSLDSFRFVNFLFLVEVRKIVAITCSNVCLRVSHTCAVEADCFLTNFALLAYLLPTLLEPDGEESKGTVTSKSKLNQFKFL